MPNPVADSMSPRIGSRRSTTSAFRHAAATSSAPARSNPSMRKAHSRLRRGASKARANRHPLAGQPCATPLCSSKSGTTPCSVRYLATNVSYRAPTKLWISLGAFVASSARAIHDGSRLGNAARMSKLKSTGDLGNGSDAESAEKARIATSSSHKLFVMSLPGTNPR